MGAWPGAPGDGARSAPEVLQTRRARPHAGSGPPPAWRERRVSGEGAAGATFPLGAGVQTRKE
jgi:hypothetical protein